MWPYMGAESLRLRPYMGAESVRVWPYMGAESVEDSGVEHQGHQ